MKLPGIYGIGAGLLLSFVFTAAGTHAQTDSPATVIGGSNDAAAVGPDQIKQNYADAKPYMDNSLPDLKHAVPALDGLKGDTNQANLQSILTKTGEALKAQLPQIPDLTAHESVWQGQFAVPVKGQPGTQDPILMGSGRRGRVQYPVEYTTEKGIEERLHSSLLTGAPWKEFDYMLLSRQSPGGIPMLEESRTDLKPVNGGQPGDDQRAVHGTGFGYMWLLFLPENMLQSNYRLLGQQKMYGHEAYVVAFAQSPDRVTVPGVVTSLGMTYPLLYQGVAWIDEATFRIVRLRTDLLAPLPGIQVQWLSSDLRFSEVRIPQLNLPLWLPHQVELTWRQGNQLVGEMHLYEKYRLFHASAKILPPS